MEKTEKFIDNITFFNVFFSDYKGGRGRNERGQIKKIHTFSLRTMFLPPFLPRGP
jgi:hypothetical protein